MSRTLPCLVLLIALVTALAAPPAFAGEDARDDAGKVMDLAFEDAPIGKVLHELARLAGRNVIVAPDVSGRVTIKLAKVGWRQAFELLAQAHDLDVQHKAGNITVVRKAGKAGAVKIRTSPGSAEAEAAEHVRRRTALEQEIVESRTRIAELEREIARAKGAQPQVKRLVTKKARAVEDVRLMIHAAQDLFASRKAAMGALIEKYRRDGGLAIHERQGNLIVRGPAAAHERLGKDLESLRAAMAKDGFVLVEKEGKARRARLMDGEVKVARARVAKAQDDMAASRARIENLARALEHLKKAGAQEEAARVAKQLAAAKERYAAASAHVGHEKPGAGVEALRAEMRALRGEVRELSALVRKLLELQAARR